jgi:hypothetical protein
MKYANGITDFVMEECIVKSISFEKQVLLETLEINSSGL